MVKAASVLFFNAVGRTNRLITDGPDYHEILRKARSPYIFAIWHSQLLLPIHYFHRYKLAVMISRSRDGEIVTNAVAPFGIEVRRGSGSRGGGGALIGLARSLKHGRHAILTTDGPRGPREEVQMGVIQLAKMTGIPATPVAFDCSRKIRLNSWDRFIVPLPFGRMRYAVGEPVFVSENAEAEEMEAKRMELKAQLDRLTLAVRF